MYFSMKFLYGLDCIEMGLNIENMYQLIASLDLYPTNMMEQEKDLGFFCSEGIHILGTHMRDLFMTKSIINFCVYRNFSL